MYITVKYVYYTLFGGGGIIICICFSGTGLGSSVPVKGTINASVYQDILDSSMLPALW